jgi:hypothetical protein
VLEIVRPGMEDSESAKKQENTGIGPAVRAARPRPEERACRRRSANSNARTRVSKDEDGRYGSPSCFETHRSVLRLWKHLRSPRAAMLLSMRGRESTNLRLYEMAVGPISIVSD